MSFRTYNSFIQRQLNGNAINILASTIKVGLITNAVAVNVNTDTVYSAYTEVSGAGYTAGGTSLYPGSSLVNNAPTAAQIIFQSGATVTWAQNASGFNTAYNAVVYDTATSALIAYSALSGAPVGNLSADLVLLGIGYTPGVGAGIIEFTY